MDVFWIDKGGRLCMNVICRQCLNRLPDECKTFFWWSDCCADYSNHSVVTLGRAAVYSATMTRLLPLSALLLVQVSSAHAAEFDQCVLIDKVLNRLGSAMAINRMIIAEGKDPIRVEQASQDLAEQNRRYRSTKRQGEKLHCDGSSRD